MHYFNNDCIYNIYHHKIKKMKKLIIIAVMLAGSLASFGQKAKLIQQKIKQTLQ